MTNRVWFAASAITICVLAASTGQAATVAYEADVLADSPLYYWSFDEADGANALNNGGSVRGNVAANELAPSLDGVRIASTTTGGGASLGSAVLGANGGNNYSTAALSNAGSIDTYAVEFWVRSDDLGDSGYIADFNGNTPGVVHAFGGNGVEIFQSGADRTGASGPSISPVGSWNHVVIGVFNDVKHSFVLNGAALVDVPIASTSPLVEGSLTVLSSLNGTYFAGAVDELAVFDLSGLTEAEFDARLSDFGTRANFVPEPASIVMLGLVGLGYFGMRRRQQVC